MEGPTPVSALIHAATMVTAGVYLIGRTHVLFDLAPTAADIGTGIGAATLFFAATVAIVQTDLKRVIAYSTISQIGYMIMAVSAAAWAGAFFHLMTHAFFKALLFMGAGSIISAMAGTQDMDRMSGLRRAMPFTFVVFTIGALALSGFPGTAGYFSKGDILALVDSRHGWYVIPYIVATITAFLTAFYAFRMVFRVFGGEPCEEARELEQGHLAHVEPFNPGSGEKEDTDVGFPGAEHHIAEREWSMKAPMIVLAVGALLLGLLQVPFVDHVITSFLEPTFADETIHVEASDSVNIMVLIIDSICAIGGIGLAWFIYRRRPGTSAALVARFKGLHNFLFHKWYFDEFYEHAVLRPMRAVARFSNRFIERGVVDGTVSGVATVVRSGNSLLRVAQNGVLRYYALVLMAGLGGLALYFLVVAN
jgi:NADH-quinone oxidoreductase subunit L